MKWFKKSLFLIVFLLPLLMVEMLHSGNGEHISVTYRGLESVDELIAEEFDCGSVKPVVYQSVVSFDALPVAQKKKAFIEMLLPSILIVEHEIRKDRERVEAIADRVSSGSELSKKDERFLNEMTRKYRTGDIDELLKRLNTHPLSIVLAQAVLETGWGSSRFFVEGNNVFGVWLFGKGRGLKAKKSEARLVKYESILHSVEDYFYMINVGWAYENFRKQRAASDTPDPLMLTSYLDKYSTQKEEYIRRLNTLIQYNDLDAYDECRIDPDYLL